MSGVEIASATARIRKLTELNSKDLAGKIACVRVDGTSPQAAPERSHAKVMPGTSESRILSALGGWAGERCTRGGGTT